MMHMDIQEITVEDTTLYYCNTKVLWGYQKDELCIMWEGHSIICFTREKTNKIISKKTRRDIDQYIKETNLSQRYIALRGLFSNRWGELFFISIYMHDTVMIFINRIEGKGPHYFLTMVKSR